MIPLDHQLCPSAGPTQILLVTQQWHKKATSSGAVQEEGGYPSVLNKKLVILLEGPKSPGRKHPRRRKAAWACSSYFDAELESWSCTSQTLRQRQVLGVWRMVVADAQKNHQAKRECQVLPLLLPCPVRRVQDLHFWQLMIAQNRPRELNSQYFGDKQN